MWAPSWSLSPHRPKVMLMLIVRLLFVKATYNKNTETGRGKVQQVVRSPAAGEVMAGKWVAPFSLGSVFSLCFSEQVGAMVIGAIEIDGARHPVCGCQAVPMAMR